MPGHLVLAVEAVPLSGANASPIAAQLRGEGYEVLVSNNVSEAVGLVFVNPRLEAVLINSYGEPRTVAARLRAINPRIPILIVEANPDGQPSAPDSEKLISLAMARLERLWQGRHQEESPGSLAGEFSCLPEKGDVVLASGRDAMKG